MMGQLFVDFTIWHLGKLVHLHYKCNFYIDNQAKSCYHIAKLSNCTAAQRYSLVVSVVGDGARVASLSLACCEKWTWVGPLYIKHDLYYHVRTRH